jgi:hypothetical protein
MLHMQCVNVHARFALSEAGRRKITASIRDMEMARFRVRFLADLGGPIIAPEFPNYTASTSEDPREPITGQGTLMLRKKRA